MLSRSEGMSKISRLRSLFAKLSKSDIAFAESLASQHDRKGMLSDKQWACVEKLISGAMGLNAGASETSKETVSLSAINALFATAHSNGLKRAKIAFSATSGNFVVSEAPATGANPGSLYVKRDGAYLGKVSDKGVFSAAFGANVEGVFDALKEFAENPGEAAKAYGKKTGNCCLCGRELTNGESITLGIGPICASKWGL